MQTARMGQRVAGHNATCSDSETAVGLQRTIRLAIQQWHCAGCGGSVGGGGRGACLVGGQVGGGAPIGASAATAGDACVDVRRGTCR